MGNNTEIGEREKKEVEREVGLLTGCHQLCYFNGTARFGGSECSWLVCNSDGFTRLYYGRKMFSLAALMVFSFILINYLFDNFIFLLLQIII